MTEETKLFLSTQVTPPAALIGMTLPMWLAVMGENRFRVQPRFWLRAFLSLIACSLNSGGARRERERYGEVLDRTAIESPIVIIGHWRSGTTHLHNLLLCDDRLCAPTMFDLHNPHTMLLADHAALETFDAMCPSTRPMDNMAAGANVPSEDEIGLCALTGMSQLLGWVFPRSAERYGRFLTFEGVDPARVEQWVEAFRTLLKKVTVKNDGRRVVLKSPQHTGRIRHVLRAFPDARFVHIHRHPFEVFPSMRNMWVKTTPWLQLQPLNERAIDEHVVRQYADLHRAFAEQRGLIPAGHFYELSYEELLADPFGRLEQIYSALGIPGFADVADAVRQYVEETRGYERNEFPELPAALRERLAREWKWAFDEFGYRA